MSLLATIAACALLTLSTANAAGIPPNSIKNLVTFGDSFTDIVNVVNGGTPWPVYAAGYGNMSLVSFARSGATCSNNITPRPAPSLFESQLPSFFSRRSDQALRLNPTETIYTLWIGTNDVGANALLTGSDKASIVDVSTCMINWVKVLYEQGARNFLFQNMIPLQNVPLYSTNSYPNRYWTAPRNTTEWNVIMTELIFSGNALTRLMLQALAPTLPGAHIGLFDSYGLFTDISDRPSAYLNGSAPLNVNNAAHACVYESDGVTNTCTTVFGSRRDSYLWFDELHPTEQANRIVAREIASVARGARNRWTTWFS